MNSRLATLATLAAFSLNGSLVMSNPVGPQTLDPGDQAYAPAVQVAQNVFRQHPVDLAHYRTTLLREGDFLVVAFIDKDSPPQSGRGNPGARPGFEVMLDARDLRVLRSNFIR